MSNESNLPVYAVPGAAGTGTADVYYLRSFSSLPDTEISKEQFDGISAAITEAEQPAGSLSQGDLINLHAAQDPASPDFQGTPAVNATIGGTAANPITNVPEQEDSIAAGQAATGTAPATEGDNPPTDPAIVTGGAPGEPPVSVNTEDGTVVQGGVQETDPGTVLSGSDVQSTPATETDPTAATSETGGTGAEDVPVSDQSALDQQLAASGIPPQADPNAGSISNSGENDTTFISDPNVGSSESSTTENSGTDSSLPQGSLSETPTSSPVVDPTNPTVVAGEPLPQTVVDSPPPPVDTTDHPIDSDTLPDPTIVQAPPADLPVENHDEWFAKEKQRVLDFLTSEEARVRAAQPSSSPTEDAGNTGS